MATRLKTVNYCFAASGPVVLAQNTDYQITRDIYLPESSKSWVDVSLTLSSRQGTGATTDTQVRSLSLQVGANTATTVNNAIRYTNSGEHVTYLYRQDMIAQFNSFWGATTQTLPVTATSRINYNAVTGRFRHSEAMEMTVTYTYDDTSPIKIKTVMIPLNSNTGVLTTSNVTRDTIPALDTYLPEAGKTYRNIYIVIQGNPSTGANANLHCVVGGDVQHTFAQSVNNLASDQFMKKIVPCDALIGNTATTHDFQLGASVARFPHMQAWMVVTYEYDEANTSSIMNSLMLPMELDSPGGSNAQLYATATREFWIQEPGTITTNRVAFYPFWNQIAAVGGLQMRIGTGAYVPYPDTAAALGGSNAGMVRNDGAFTLARGRNVMNFDVYRNDTADFMWNLCGFFLVNYTSGKPTEGSCAANKTVRNCIKGIGTTTGYSNSVVAWASSIPETEYYLSAVGTELIFNSNTTTSVIGFTVRVEKKAEEGGYEWMPGYRDICQTDPETGPMLIYSQMRYNFKRFPDDADPSRVDIKTSRRIETYTTATATGSSGWHSLDILTTYHSIKYNVAGTVANSAGGNVVLSLCRTATGEVVLKQNVAANGSFNFTWYDNTEPLFISAEGLWGKFARSNSALAVV